MLELEDKSEDLKKFGLFCGDQCLHRVSDQTKMKLGKRHDRARKQKKNESCTDRFMKDPQFRSIQREQSFTKYDMQEIDEIACVPRVDPIKNDKGCTGVSKC